jgi:hypothetical protein
MAGWYGFKGQALQTPLRTKDDQVQAIGARGVPGDYEFLAPFAAIS